MFAPRNILNNQIPNKAQTFGNGNSKYFFFEGKISSLRNSQLA